MRTIEEELTLAKERLELTQTAGGITSWEWDLVTDRMIWTAGRQNLVRLGAEQTMRYADVVATVHPDDQAATLAAARHAVANPREPYRAEFRVPIPDGSVRWILSRGKVFCDESGSPLRMLGVNMDITDRKRAELALAESEERFRATIEHAAVGIAHILPNSHFALANAHFRKLFGYDAAELAAITVRDIFLPEDLGEAVQQRLRLFAGEIDSYTVERRYRRKDGSTFMAEAATSVVRDEKGHPKYAVVIVTDVTASKQAAERVQRALAEADAANLAKSQFLANVSHEIRTPLTAILGFAELLKSPQRDEEKRRHFVDVIDRNAQSLKALIDDLLDLSKIEAGRVDFERERTSLPVLFEEIAADLGPQAAAKGIELAITNATPVPEVVYTDALRLKQVLLNVIGNAVKFTDVGHVTVTVRTRPTARAGTTGLEIRVIDTGVGIAEGQQAKLFQAFAQGDASMTRRFGGSGLGLVLSRHMARLFGGDLVLESSKPGVGSVFVATFVLDLVPREAGEDRGHGVGQVAAESSLVGARVLIAEDCEDTRSYLGEVLALAGAVTTIVENGRAAVDTALQGGFDLVLMDLQMPELDGREAVRELRARGYDGKIVAVSAHAFADERRRCLEGGCDGFVAKPVRPNDLLEAITAALRG